MTKIDEKVLAFWNERAKLGEIAGSNDFPLAQIESDYLCEVVPHGARVLDLGCGSGRSMVALGTRNNCHGVGVDFAAGMVDAAQKALKTAGLDQRFSVHQHATPPAPTQFGAFDLVYSERCLINLGSTELQRDTVASIASALKPGGTYVMVECSIEGLERTNALRRGLGLPALSPPWHNLYMHEAEIATWGTPSLRLERLVHITSTYHFVSRVLNAKLAADRGEEPRYDAAVNMIAAQLPRDIGEFGPSKAWIWRRT